MGATPLILATTALPAMATIPATARALDLIREFHRTDDARGDALHAHETAPTRATASALRTAEQAHRQADIALDNYQPVDLPDLADFVDHWRAMEAQDRSFFGAMSIIASATRSLAERASA